MLKRYIAELNIKIFPDKYNKNYGDENIKINLSISEHYLIYKK